MNHLRWITQIEDYEHIVGRAAVDRLLVKAQRLRGLRVLNVSSTFYGGGVAEMLSSSTLLGRALGLRVDWRLIQGSPEFFGVTKKLHNGLQGQEINLSQRKKDIYEQMAFENALRMDIDHDLVIVHDPQPLPLIGHYRRTTPWVWRCHVDLSQPDREVWDYLRGFADDYDAVVVSLPEYRQKGLLPPQLVIMPGIDPFSPKNRGLTKKEIDERLRHYKIPIDLPIITQVSRFDRWKDPEGVIKAFRKVRKEVDCTLVLLGNVATDDPEGQQVFEALLKHKEDRIVILTATDSTLVNALQRCSAIVIQKSRREGFGLTVTEAMWKGAAVVGGDCGGIRRQIEDGVSGFLVSSVEEAAERIVQLLRDAELRQRLGSEARATVTGRFLMNRVVEQMLDMADAFESFRSPNRDRIASLAEDGPADT
jgi:trehalose synthase